MTPARSTAETRAASGRGLTGVQIAAPADVDRPLHSQVAIERQIETGLAGPVVGRMGQRSVGGNGPVCGLRERRIHPQRVIGDRETGWERDPREVPHRDEGVRRAVKGQVTQAAKIERVAGVEPEHGSAVDDDLAEQFKRMGSRNHRAGPPREDPVVVENQDAPLGRMRGGFLIHGTRRRTAAVVIAIEPKGRQREAGERRIIRHDHGNTPAAAARGVVPGSRPVGPDRARTRHVTGKEEDRSACAAIAVV